MDRHSLNKSSFSFVYYRFHKRGAYDVENEEKVKLGLASNHWRDKERWVVRNRATSTYTDKHLCFFLLCCLDVNEVLLIATCFVFLSFMLGTDAEILPQNRKREVNHERRSLRKEDRTWRREQRLLSSWPSAWWKLNGQLNIFLKASEEDGPPETGILTAQRMDWRCDERQVTSVKERGEEEEEEGTRLDSELLLDCVKSGRLRLNWTKLILNESSTWNCFFLSRQHFVFSCTSPSFFLSFFSFCVQ